MPKYDTPYKVHTLINPPKIVANKKIVQYEYYKWIRSTRFSSDDAKTKNKSDKKLVEEVQQRIIELNEEKLGKLKERVLDIEPITSAIDEKEEVKIEATKLATKQSTESKELLKDDAVSKKGTTLHIGLHSGQ